MGKALPKEIIEAEVAVAQAEKNYTELKAETAEAKKELDRRIATMRTIIQDWDQTLPFDGDEEAD